MAMKSTTQMRLTSNIKAFCSKIRCRRINRLDRPRVVREPLQHAAGCRWRVGSEPRLFGVWGLRFGFRFQSLGVQHAAVVSRVYRTIQGSHVSVNVSGNTHKYTHTHLTARCGAAGGILATREEFTQDSEPSLIGVGVGVLGFGFRFRILGVGFGVSGREGR